MNCCHGNCVVYLIYAEGMSIKERMLSWIPHLVVTVKILFAV